MNTKILVLASLAILTIILILYSWTQNPPQTNYFEIIDEETEPLLFTSAIRKNQLFNLKFNYELNSKICENTSEILAVFIVTSYFGNMETRSAMRRAFSREDLNQMRLKRVFLLGLAPKDKYTNQNSIRDESNRFGDIVQGNFVEAYRNLTYKHVMGLNWVETYCSSAKYVIKMDDDIVVNIRKLVGVLEDLKLPTKNLLGGYILKGMVAIREPANKWYVTKDEYPNPAYPPFVSGWFYITNPSTISKLLTISNSQKYFWIDDVFVTGILAQKLKVRLYDLGKYFAVHPEFLECCIRDVDEKNLDCDVIVGPNGGDNNLFYRFNEAIKRCYFGHDDKCVRRRKSLNETCVAERKFNLGRGNAVVESYQLH